jgi:DNA polymerase elongation subunit (family B)
MGGNIIKINSALIYPKFDYVFNDFVEYFETFRKINDTYKTLGKLMVNSFYGRTGLKPKEEISFFIQTKKELDDITKLYDKGDILINSLEEINDIWFITIQLTEASTKTLNKLGYSIKKEQPFNIAIASSITAKARIKLYNGFLNVQKNGGRILYCDTDSIIASFYKKVDNEKHGEIF